VNVAAENSKSYWQANQPSLRKHSLAQDMETDVVIVGGGIAGLSVAYEVAALHRRVVVLDRGDLASGMTARTSAHLASHVDDGFSELIRLRGEDEAGLHYQAHVAAIDRAQAICGAENINCDFARIDGYLLRDPATKLDELRAEFEASKKIGMDDTQWLDRISLPGIHALEAIRYPRQGRFNPLKYAHGLVRILEQRGVELYGSTVVEAVEENSEGVVARTSDGRTVKAQFAVIATNSPINDVVALHTKQAPYRTYVFAARIVQASLPDALFWDTADPYHYVRIDPRPDQDSDILIVGGGDHKSGQANDIPRRFADLERWTGLVFGSIEKVEHQWSGQVLEPVDYGAFIGLNPGNQRTYVVTGDSGQGLTHGIFAGMLIKELISGRQSRFQNAFDPSRRTVRAMSDFISENASVVANMAEHIAGAQLSSVDDLKPGQGAIVRQGLSMVAAYRSESGRLFLRSASCSHLGCVVHWNDFEKCWDCPCHGSHFAPDGTTLNGPAIQPLAELK
jgi:glycine/D-amino acid oxidase-like deaminating enzyme/nitrite reductase/ring-hydroxylating ferredoxin subunit